MADKPNWDPIRALARRVLREDGQLILTEDVRQLLVRTASEVAIPAADATAALATEAGARTLLEECSRRIREGSDRLTDALHFMYRHKDAGDFDRARQLMRDVLAVEVVPFYRDIAEGQLDDMADDP
ncbi:DUSAM domain-containing protein [Myxococcus stipitatus]|uniref:DUSAM domain-containing protein n=1 Tax=Myxococcus stipitatus TaxID=83455 RepID=UPI0031455A5C